MNLELGFDIDDDNPQLVHACYPYPKGAICGSSRLWFHAGKLENDKVTCSDCIQLLNRESNEPE